MPAATAAPDPTSCRRDCGRAHRGCGSGRRPRSSRRCCRWSGCWPIRSVGLADDHHPGRRSRATSGASRSVTLSFSARLPAVVGSGPRHLDIVLDQDRLAGQRPGRAAAMRSASRLIHRRRVDRDARMQSGRRRSEFGRCAPAASNSAAPLRRQAWSGRVDGPTSDRARIVWVRSRRAARTRRAASNSAVRHGSWPPSSNNRRQSCQLHLARASAEPVAFIRVLDCS